MLFVNGSFGSYLVDDENKPATGSAGKIIYEFSYNTETGKAELTPLDPERLIGPATIIDILPNQSNPNQFTYRDDDGETYSLMFGNTCRFYNITHSNSGNWSSVGANSLSIGNTVMIVMSDDTVPIVVAVFIIPSPSK